MSKTHLELERCEYKTESGNVCLLDKDEHAKYSDKVDHEFGMMRFVLTRRFIERSDISVIVEAETEAEAIAELKIGGGVEQGDSEVYDCETWYDYD